MESESIPWAIKDKSSLLIWRRRRAWDIFVFTIQFAKCFSTSSILVLMFYLVSAVFSLSWPKFSSFSLPLDKILLYISDLHTIFCSISRNIVWENNSDFSPNVEGNLRKLSMLLSKVIFRNENENIIKSAEMQDGLVMLRGETWSKGLVSTKSWHFKFFEIESQWNCEEGKRLLSMTSPDRHRYQKQPSLKNLSQCLSNHQEF